jgi:hypothetical protein
MPSTLELKLVPITGAMTDIGRATARPQTGLEQEEFGVTLSSKGGPQ